MDGLPGYNCTPLFKTGYWRTTYCVRRATHGLPHKINEFVILFIWNSFLSKLNGLPGYHSTPLFKAGYWRATSQNQWICIFIHLKFISKQSGRATRLPLYSFVQNRLLTGYFLCKTGYQQTTSQNQWMHIFIHLKIISERRLPIV